MKILRPIANALSRRGRSFSVSFTSFASLTSLTSLASFHDRVRLDLHQHFRRDQLAHFHHARCRADLSEKIAVRPPDFFPLSNVGYKNPCSYDVLQARAGLAKRRLDVLDRLHR